MAYTFNTGNPVWPNGSADARDLVDNAQVADRLITSTELTVPDRLGVQRRTWSGIQQAVVNYVNRGQWTTATAYHVNDIWRDGPTGAFYLVLADYTSGASAAADIAGGNVVVHQPKDWVVSVDTVSGLRALEPAFYGQQVSVKTEGIYYYDQTDNSSADDGDSTIVTTGGARYKKVISYRQDAVGINPTEWSFDSVPNSSQVFSAASSNRAADILLAKEQTTVVIIGDSITTGFGYGAPDPTRGWSQLFSASVFEMHDNDVYSSKRSLGYPLVSNMREFMNSPGISGSGTPLIGYSFPSNEGYRLLHNQYIEITGRQAQYYDLFYDRDANGSEMGAGTVEITVNGVLRATKAVTTGTGIGTTYPTDASTVTTWPIQPTDVVRLTYKSATSTAADRIYVVGVSTVRQNTNTGPAILKFNYPGWTFNNFIPLITDIKSMAYAMRHSGSTKELYVLALGSNSIYNSGVAQTPQQYVQSIKDMATAIGVNNSARWLAVWIPPKATSAPINGDYEDFVAAVRQVCADEDYSCIDMSGSRISGNPDYLIDTIHPNAEGHAILAADVCAAVGVPYTPKNAGKYVPKKPSSAPLTTASGWTDTSGKASALEKDNVVTLSGVFEPAGASSGLAFSVPSNFRPTRTITTLVASSAGAKTLTIPASGNAFFNDYSASWYSVDGVSYKID